MKNRKRRLSDCRIIELPKVYDARGSLTFMEGLRHIPFEIKRVYYFYDVPGGESRAGHAHVALQQVIVAVSGTFDITLKDAAKTRTFSLNRPNLGLYVPSMIWREIDNFSSGAVCLALASESYDELDYIRDYRRFVELAGHTEIGVQGSRRGRFHRAGGAQP